MGRSLVVRSTALVALLVLMAAPAAGQIVPETQRASVYRFVEPGTPAMDVRMWGAVRAPGIYQVARGTDLLALLSLAGGPLQPLDSPNVERHTTVIVSRGEGATRSVVYEAPLADLLRTAGPLPDILDGDVVSVDIETRQRFGWRDGLTIFSSIGTIAVIVLNIVRLSN